MRGPLAALVLGALGLAFATGGIACKDPYSAKVTNGVFIPHQAFNIGIGAHTLYAATDPIFTDGGCSRTSRSSALKCVVINLLLTGKKTTLGDYFMFEAWSCNPNTIKSESRPTDYSGPQACDYCNGN
jgi:hypothetical protein